VFEKGVLRRIFGPKRDEVSREWRKLRNEELNAAVRNGGSCAGGKVKDFIIGNVEDQGPKRINNI
jgi:hypothetical protein